MILFLLICDRIASKVTPKREAILYVGICCVSELSPTLRSESLKETSRVNLYLLLSDGLFKFAIDMSNLMLLFSLPCLPASYGRAENNYKNNKGHSTNK